MNLASPTSNLSVCIDTGSGFCFGVVTAIESAEKELKDTSPLFCLGDIVHNSLEVERLEALGLRTINHEELQNLSNKKVLLRAHGEPPATYEIAKAQNIQIVDATCPVVLKLQKRILKRYQEVKDTDAQIIIYGKIGHAEVNGLVGQTEGTALVIESLQDVSKIDFNHPIYLYSQTTKSLDGFRQVVEYIKQNISPSVPFKFHDTICRQVANRLPSIKCFAAEQDWVYFVAGKKSSNGKMLFEECKKANPNTIFISAASEITEKLPTDVKKVGVCGATSTPKWLMEEVAKRITEINR